MSAPASNTISLHSVGKGKSIVVSLGDSAELLFSYGTLVGGRTSRGLYCYTTEKFSVTTSRHIVEWFGGANSDCTKAISKNGWAHMQKRILQSIVFPMDNLVDFVE